MPHSETWTPPEDLRQFEQPKPTPTSGQPSSDQEETAISQSLRSHLATLYPGSVISTLHFQTVIFKAQLLSDQQISQLIGKSESWVDRVTRLPWYTDALAEALKILGRPAVDDLLEAVEYDSIKTLIQIQRDPKASPGVRKAAAAELLDRKRGKPTQYVKTESEVITYESAPAEAAALLREMSSIDDQLKKRGVRLESNTN